MKPIPRHPLRGDPDWLRLAFEERGTSEVKGPEHNPRVLEYHRYTTLSATTDEVPWCSSFMCWLFEEGKITSTNSAAAQSWLRWGVEIDKPKRGCIVVFERYDADGMLLHGRGHVGLWVGESNGITFVLGGNQRDAVNVSGYRTETVLGYRWPRTSATSTTNYATIVAGGSAVVSALPSINTILDTYADNEDSVTGIMELVTKGVQLLTDTMGGLSPFSLFVVFAALLWIVKERNKKIRRYGI